MMGDSGSQLLGVGSKKVALKGWIHEYLIWANYSDQTAKVTPNGGVVTESPPK